MGVRSAAGAADLEEIFVELAAPVLTAVGDLEAAGAVPENSSD